MSKKKVKVDQWVDLEPKNLDLVEVEKTPSKRKAMHEVYRKEYSPWRYYAVPFAPLSHNNAYGTARSGKRFMRTEYEEYSKTITDYIRLVDHQTDDMKLYGDAYEIVIAGIYNRDAFFFKKGSVKKVDPDGFIKIIQDAVFRYLEADDSTVLKVTSYKVEMTPLPFDEKRYSESPVWDLKGGVFCIGIRTVPVRRASEIKRDDDPQLHELINNAIRLEDYQEPRVNMNRGKKEQARRHDRRKGHDSQNLKRKKL
jgi:hypothetical protein